MERFKNCSVKLDKNKIIKLVCFFYGSVSSYCVREKISRARFYEILNSPHLNSDADCIKKLAKNLKCSTGEIVLK